MQYRLHYLSNQCFADIFGDGFLRVLIWGNLATEPKRDADAPHGAAVPGQSHACDRYTEAKCYTRGEMRGLSGKKHVVAVEKPANIAVKHFEPACGVLQVLEGVQGFLRL